MSNKSLTILGIITAAMIAWAIAQSSISNRPAPKQNAQGYLFQGLDPAGIDSIVLGKGKDIITLKRSGDGFVVKDKDNYPAHASEINNLIAGCLDIKSAGFYTDNPDNHEALGVTEEKAKSVVRFLKPDASLLAGVIIGKAEEEGAGVFARLISDNKVYRIMVDPYIKDSAMNFVDPDIFTLDRGDIESITVSTKESSYTLNEDAESGKIVIQDIPEGKKLNETVPGEVFTALMNVKINDVKSMESIGGDLEFANQYVCRLKNSTVYTLKIAKKDEKTYMTCNAEFLDTAPVVKADGVESDEELKKKEAKLLAHENANEFSGKHKNWVYEVMDYYAGKLVKELPELLEDDAVSEENDGTGDAVPMNIGE